MSSLSITREVENNLRLNLQSERSTIKYRQWKFVTQWLYHLTKKLGLRDECLFNALYLVSDYFSVQYFPKFAIKVYATACLELSSSLVEEAYIPLEEFVKVGNGEYTLDHILEARKKIVRHRNGKLRMLTVVDVLGSQEMQDRIVSTVSLLCCIRHPTFTTIDADLFATACVDFVEGNNHGDILVQDIRSYITTFQYWADQVGFELTEEDLFVLELFTQIEGEANTLAEVSSSVLPKRKKIEYEIVRSLGVGSTAEVFYAVAGDKVIAVKDQEIETESSNFITELTVLSTYKHENIVELFGFSLKRSRITFEMEAGVSLYFLIFGEKEPNKAQTKRDWLAVFLENERIEDRLLPDREELGDDIVQGIKYLHSVGVLHNDIKPENVIVVVENNTRRAKLIDFGIAELMVFPPGVRSHRDYAQTITYRCPELLVQLCDENSEYTRNKEGHVYGPDIWAAGATLLCLETGVVCFSHVNMQEKQLGMACNILENITLILGSPPSELYENYPFHNKKPFGLGSIQSSRTRARILAMLNYYPEERILA